MTHTTRDGRPKIVRECTYPLTAKGSVKQVITDIAVIRVAREGLVIEEVFPGLTPEDIQSVTDPKLIISGSLKNIEL